MSRVLVISTSKYTRGGITAVIKAHREGEQWKKYHCKWIGYHIDRGVCLKVIFLVQALIRYCYCLPFYQIVHLQFSLISDAKRAYIFFGIAKLFNKKTIVHLHCGDQLPEIWGWRYEVMFTRCDMAIVLSQSIKRKIEEYLGTDNKIEVLYNPCPSVCRSESTDKATNYILFAGTLCNNKGYEDLIRGFAKVSKSYPDWKIVFAGNGEIERGKAVASELGISDQTVFLGWVDGDEKERAFRQASIFCLPSYAEGFPMAVLDAWAYGLPVITTPVGGITDIAADGENVLLFNPGDINVLAWQMKRLISDEALRHTMQRESIQLANTTFNINTINEKLGLIYKDSLTD